MVTMSFRVTKDELGRFVRRLKQDAAILEREEDEVDAVVDFLQAFLIDVDDELTIGHYNYELVVDNETIPLDDEASDELLRILVREACVTVDDKKASIP